MFRFDVWSLLRLARNCALVGVAWFGCAHGKPPEGKSADDGPRSSANVAIPAVAASQSQMPLPSWREGAIKQALLAFVAHVTEEGGSGFVPPAERLAVFDNDGTLWTEQPVPVQLAFAVDRVQVLAPDHPEWFHEQPFQAVLAHDRPALRGQSEQALAKLLAATHTGMTSEEFAGIVTRWFESALHPRYGRPYTDLVYQPMLELLSYLRTNGFKTYVVSGGGAEFVRAFSDRIYGIPPEQVVGSTGKLEYQRAGDEPVLRRLPAVDFVDDKGGKPVGIQKFVGRRPILAVGNSDGDFEMLEWTTTGGEHPGLGVLVHHTDGDREFAYDREFAISPLSRALDEAPERRWLIVDMKRDWSVIYPFEEAGREGLREIGVARESGRVDLVATETP
jgi:hypothetical protein